MNPRRRYGCHAVRRVSRVNNQPRPGSRREGERDSTRPKLPERSSSDNDWMKPMEEDDLRALEAAWGFVE